MEAARHLVVNSWWRGKVTTDNLLTSLQRWGPIDYRVVEDPDVRASLSWTVTRPGTGHGLVAGFDRTVSEGCFCPTRRTRPTAIRPAHIYGTVFFPWPSPVALRAGDVVTVDLEARLIGVDYVWSWATRVQNQEHSGEDKAGFSQSTFFGTPLSPANLKKMASSYTPALNEDGRIVRVVLESMDDGVSVGEIAKRLSARVFATFSSSRRRPEPCRGPVATVRLTRHYSSLFALLQLIAAVSRFLDQEATR